MKNKLMKILKIEKDSIQKLAWLFAVLSIVLVANSQAFAKSSNINSPVYTVSGFLEVKRKLPEVKIVQVESESSKRDRLAKTASRVTPRETTVRENPVSVQMSFDEKRALTRSAAQANGIRPELLEAVWQVESGKSTECVKNHGGSGATGGFQFMPSTFRAYSGGDICNINDQAYAAAKLLANGGADNGDEFGALLHYNHSSSYANLVLSIANSI